MVLFIKMNNLSYVYQKCDPEKNGFQVVYDDNTIKIDLEDVSKSFQMLTDLVQELNVCHKDPTYVVHETVHSLKNKVDLSREEMKLKIDQLADCLIAQLDTYEIECRVRIDSNEKVIDKTENIHDYLLVDDEITLKKLAKTIQNELFNLKNRLLDIKDNLLMNKMAHFESKVDQFERIKSHLRLSLFDSKILSPVLEASLLNLCNFGQNTSWKLLYRASESGYTARDFHAACDDLPNTLTIIKSTSGNVFGGFNRTPWDQSNAYKEDKHAFLYSLTNSERTPIKLPVVPGSEKTAMYCSNKHGPCFGVFNSYDLFTNTYFDLYKNSSNLGHSYRHSIVRSAGSYQARSFLAGHAEFAIVEMEVYQLLDD